MRWHRSGGELWSLTVAGVHHLQIFRESSDAVDPHAPAELLLDWSEG
jgi:hypothetical protein